MSELKVYHHELRHNEYEEFYLKYEADKVIAEKDKEIARQNTEIKNAVIDLTLRDKKNDELAIALKHQKYKRCLTMAMRCRSRACFYDTMREGSLYWAWKSDNAYKWHKRWLELAEKFKDKEANANLPLRSISAPICGRKLTETK